MAREHVRRAFCRARCAGAAGKIQVLRGMCRTCWHRHSRRLGRSQDLRSRHRKKRRLPFSFGLFPYELRPGRCDRRGTLLLSAKEAGDNKDLRRAHLAAFSDKKHGRRKNRCGALLAAALIHRAIGDQLTCVFVDHGLLRLNEGKNVMNMFARNLGVKVIHVDAEDQFMAKLAGVTDPEKKRKIIGAEFIEVFDAEEKKLTNAKWLAQGTIYPDVIESAGAKTNKAHAIKSHHNVGGLPENMKLKLLEPLRDLFKDEVRELGVALGLPREMVYRHPFPGPGLGVRILGEVKKEYADLLRQADDIFIQELRNTTDENGTSWYDLTSQAFAVFLPVKSVGVMGDGRTYDYVVALRAVVTSDFMTAHWAELPYSLLGRVSNRIINEVKGINRVVYDVSGKPPATIEWE